MSANEILNEVLEFTGENYNSLAKKIGLKRSQNLYDIRDGKVKAISLSLATLINRYYPQFTIEWLTQDPKLKSAPPAVQVDIKDPHTIPIYDIEIDAGNVARLIDDNNNVPVVGHLQLYDSLNTSGLMGVRAKGDSMATFINGGDIMLIRKLESRSFIPPGHAYVVIGKELTVVKYIRKGSTPDHWVLRSHNEYYEDFEVEKSDVIHLFIVVKVLKELTY